VYRLPLAVGEKQRLTRTEIYGENPRRAHGGFYCSAYPGYPRLWRKARDASSRNFL